MPQMVWIGSEKNLRELVGWVIGAGPHKAGARPPEFPYKPVPSGCPSRSVAAGPRSSAFSFQSLFTVFPAGRGV